MTTCKLLFNKPTCTGKRVFERRSGVAAVQHNTTLEETHKQCRGNKNMQFDFYLKVSGSRAVKNPKASPFSSPHWRLFPLSSVTACFVCSSKSVMSKCSVPSARRASIRRVLAPLLQRVYLWARVEGTSEMCMGGWALSPDCKYTSEVPHWHHTLLGSHTHWETVWGSLSLFCHHSASRCFCLH